MNEKKRNKFVNVADIAINRHFALEKIVGMWYKYNGT